MIDSGKGQCFSSERLAGKILGNSEFPKEQSKRLVPVDLSTWVLLPFLVSLQNRSLQGNWTNIQKMEEFHLTYFSESSNSIAQGHYSSQTMFFNTLKLTRVQWNILIFQGITVTSVQISSLRQFTVSTLEHATFLPVT